MKISFNDQTKKFQLVSEDAIPVNNVGDGRIAGTDNNPPVKKKIKLLRRKGSSNVKTTTSNDL